MLLVAPVRKERRRPLPEGYQEMGMWDRLYVERSSLPAITHVDYSARIQSVSRDVNPRYWQLIDTFRQTQGCAVLVNTSFNVRGEPVVCTPSDAYRCFMRTEMDHLVMGDCLFSKADQPPLPEDRDWMAEFELD
jgi:carbamoyltransferase